MKRMLLTLLAAFGLMVPTLRAQDAWDGTTVDTTWYGDGSDASYDISTPAQLAGLAELVNAGNTFEGKTITLTASIDLAGKAWTPIGTKDNTFRGTFDGTGKTISNLKVTGEASYVGLFGRISSPAKLAKLTVENASVAGLANVGALAGAVYTGTVEDCHVEGRLVVEGKYMVGGLAGSGYADIHNCSVRGTAENPAIVTATYLETDLEGDNVGGLVGFRGEGKGIETVGCSVEYVRVTGSRKVGGLIGSAFQDNAIEGCSVANATVACNAPTDYANRYTNKPTNGFGGLVGLYTKNAENDGTLLDCSVSDITFTAADDVKGSLSMGGISGGLRGGVISGKPPVAPADTLTVGNITVSGTNTGATNDYLADAPTYAYPTDQFSSASAFIASFAKQTEVANATVYDGTTYYATMDAACKAVHLSTDKRTLWCKPDATVAMGRAHVHVCQSLTVYGNNATVTGGEHDFELDTFKLDGCAGIQDVLSLSICALNEVAVWGQRTTTHTLNVTLEDCKDINRVYISGTKGANNITLTNCTASKKSSSCTVYSNAPGAITVKGCSFADVPAPINLNNKSVGTQVVTVMDCSFKDCAIAGNCTGEMPTYAASIRALTTTEGGITTLNVTNCAFDYSAGATKCNGDILLGDGRGGTTSYPAVTAKLANTAAEVQVQQPGDRTASGITLDESQTHMVANTEEKTITMEGLPTRVAAVNGTRYATFGEALQAVQTLAQQGKAVTIQLLANYTGTEDAHFQIAEGMDVTLDLNGFAMIGINKDAFIKNYGTLTITDGSAVDIEKCTGRIYTTNVEAQGRCAIANYGTLTIEGGTFGDSDIDRKNANTIQRGNALRNYGTATIKGGFFTACDNYVNGGYAYAIANGGGGYPEARLIIANCTVYGCMNGAIAADGGTLTVKGGTYTLGNGGSQNLFRLLYVSGTGKIQVEGGTFTRNVKNDNAFAGSDGTEGSIVIAGGTFENKVADKTIKMDGTASISVSGGTFNNAVTANTNTPLSLSGGTYKVQPDGAYCAPGFEVKQNADGTYGVQHIPVAQIGETMYYTLQDAIEAAKNGDTVTLLMDVSVDKKMLSIPEGLALTLDLNGHTYTYTDDAERYAIMLGATSTLTVTDSSAAQSGTVKATGTALCCLNNNGGTLNVRGGRFVLESGRSSYAIISGGVCVLEPEGEQTIALTGGLSLRTVNGIGTARIAGNTTITGEDNYYAIYVGNGANGVSVEIEDGTFERDSGNSVICVDGGSAATFDISGGKFTGKFGGNGTGTYTLSGGSYSVDPSTTASPSKVTLAPNLLAVQNAEFYYDVGPFVVEITEGEAKGGYATLQDAVDAVSALDPAPESLPTITLLRDVVLEGAVTLTKNISIDLAGHTLYAKDGTKPAFTAETAVTVTFEKDEGAGTVNGSFVSAAQKDASNVTIDGLTPLAITKWTDEGAYDLSWTDSLTSDTIEVTTPQMLAGICVLAKTQPDDIAPYSIKLMGNIDLSALVWEPIPSFTATFDGNGYTISGIRVEEVQGSAGLFATLNGTVENLRVEKATVAVKGKSSGLGVSKKVLRYGGVVAGTLGGRIENCAIVGGVVKPADETTATEEGLGGLAGKATTNAQITNCSVSATVTSDNVGSFVGAGSATITNCYVDGTLTQATGTLTNVYAKNAGGLFVRHNTVDDALSSETLGDGAQLNGIGWLLNGQKTKPEDAPAWRVDSNEDCTTLLPFKADGVEVIPDVDHRLTTSSNWDTPFPGSNAVRYGYYANGHTATVTLNAEDKPVLTTYREDYRVDEELEITDTPTNVAIFGGSFGGEIVSTDLTVENTGNKTFGSVFAGSFSKDAEHPAKITGTARLTINGGRVTKAYGGSCGEASEVASAKLTLNGGTVTTAVATSNGGAIMGTATLEVAFGAVTAAKLVAMERGTAKDVTFTMRGATTGGICLSAESAEAEVSVSGTVKLDNRVADPGTVYLGAALGKVATVNLVTQSSSPITVLAQTAAKAKTETVTIPAGHKVTIGYNVTLQVPANVTLEVAGMVTLSNGKLVGTSGTSLLNVSEGGSVPSSLPQGLSAWDVATLAWVQAQIKAGNGTYYGTVAQALAALNVGDAVTLLSRGVATGNVLATSAGKTVSAGAAYDVADVLGGVFTVTVENNTPRLVYAYDLGVGGLTIRKVVADEATGEVQEGDLVVEVTVKLAEGGAAPSGTRTLEGCTLTVTSILDKDETKTQTFTLTEGLAFTDGECKVTIPYTEETFPMGTSHLTVSVSKGEVTSPAERGE